VWANGEIAPRWEPRPRSRPYDFGCPYNLLNHPVVGVTWYEALAFTRWLTARWRASGLLLPGWEVRLPSEAEWEKGARGGETVPAAPVVVAAGRWDAGAPRLVRNPHPERRFPWVEYVGPRLANTSESAINATSAAGLFPLGASPCGCEEMAGTVWEWTRSVQAQYPYRPDDGRENLSAGINEGRVLRGGAYYSESNSCRCARRDRNNPYYRFDYCGLRALVAPS